MTVGRSWFINGPAMMSVKAGVDAIGMAGLTEFALTRGPISVTPQFSHRDINLDAWGDAPAETQAMLGTLSVSADPINFDPDVLSILVALAAGRIGSVANEGTLPMAGQLMGGNAARFASGWKYVSLNIYAPISGRPFRFYNAYLTSPQFAMPLGTEKSVVPVTFRVIPYIVDPWQGGLASAGQILWDRTLDT